MCERPNDDLLAAAKALAKVLSDVVLESLRSEWRHTNVASGRDSRSRQHLLGRRESHVGGNECDGAPNACAGATGQRILRAPGGHDSSRVFGFPKGQMIGSMDLLIAAHAVSLNVRLVTHNSREFGRVPGLHIEDWQ
jgi:hypothetical protein